MRRQSSFCIVDIARILLIWLYMPMWLYFWICDGVLFLLGVFVKSCIVLVWTQVTFVLRLSSSRSLQFAMRGGTAAFVAVQLALAVALVFVLLKNARSDDNPDGALLLYMACVTLIETLGVVGTGIAARVGLQHPALASPTAGRIGWCMLLYLFSFVGHFTFSGLFVSGLLPFDVCYGFKVLACELILLEVAPSLGVLYVLRSTLRELEQELPIKEKLLVA